MINSNSMFVGDQSPLTWIVAYQEDSNGELYMLDLFNPGEVFRVATTSEQATWDGDGAVGLAGDGQTWGDANNWSRGGSSDSAVVSNDPLRFAGGSSQQTIDLGADRSVAAVSFSADYVLTNHMLSVQSGNISVDAGVTATIESNLMAASVHRAIKKHGQGVLLIEGDAAQTVVYEGTLGGSGTLDHLTVRSGGTVAPGASAGILSVDETVTLEAGSTLHIEIGGADNSDTQNPEYDQLLVGGQVTLAGSLEVEFLQGAGYTPVGGDSFTIIASSMAFEVDFSSTSLPELQGGLLWEIDPSDGSALILDIVTELSSDFNRDGRVDAADYALWRNSLGDVGAGLAADATGVGGTPDGVVDELDYNLWRANYGSVWNVPLATAAPEPASLLLLTLVAGVAPLRRNRSVS